MAGETVGKAVPTQDLQSDRFTGKGDRLVGKGDRLPNRVVEHPMETHDTGIRKLNSPPPTRGPRQTGFMPRRVGGGGGFGPHVAMGGGSHGGFGRH
jgi:hypothetical protein